MKATFNDFIMQNPNCKKFDGDEDMVSVFSFLSQDSMIIQMIDASEAGKPALSPVAVNIENVFHNLDKTHTNSLDDNFTKQAVGLMIKTILEPFGYTVWKQKGIPKDVGATKFKSASTYSFDQTAPRSMKIVKRIEEVY